MKKTMSPLQNQYFFTPKNTQIKPILYLTEFRLEKFGPHQWGKDFERYHCCLLKYSPKYCRNLEIRLNNNKGDHGRIRMKVKQVKILKKLWFRMANKNKLENTLKGLIRTSQKTLRSLPTCEYLKEKSTYYESYRKLPNFHWHMDFPMIKNIDLTSWNDLDFKVKGDMKPFSRLLEQKLHKECGFFWMANRGLRSIGISNRVGHFWMIMKKLNGENRFLRNLRTLELDLKELYRSIRETLVSLTKNKYFLERVTYLRLDSFLYLLKYKGLVESFLECCPRLSYLSIHINAANIRDHLAVDAYVDSLIPINLSQSLQNLKVLHLTVNYFRAFINGIDLPISIERISFVVSGVSEFYPILDSQDIYEGDDDHDQRDWESFENSKVLLQFFEKWRKLINLKDLTWTWRIGSKMKPMVHSFFLPLPGYGVGPEDRVFELDTFLQGVQSLSSLKHLTISESYGKAFFVRYNPQKVAFPENLSSIAIEAKSSPDFAIQKFFKAFLKNMDFEACNLKKNVSLSRIRMSCAQDLINLLNLLHSISRFKTVVVDLEVDLFVEDIYEIVSNFQYPIYLVGNTKLTFNIILPWNSAGSIQEEDKEHVRMVFGQLKFAVYETKKSQSEFFILDERPKLSYHEDTFLILESGLTNAD